jgi:hypothetical protein
METNDELLTVREAAILRGVALNQIYLLIWSGRFPGATKDEFGEWKIPAAVVPRRSSKSRQS